MEKIKIEVPEGIRFLSDWEEFKLSNFPGKCIINKQIPGCGFTEYCIRSRENIILCSPRKLLLYNKWDQHQGEVYLVVNEMDKDPGVDKDLTKETKDYSKNSEKTEEEKKKVADKRHEIYQRLYSELEMYRNKCVIGGKPMKVLVTYDSYHIVVDILNRLNIFQMFYTVVDEFQSILHDSRFKSDTELGFLNVLRERSESALFVSATPMMDEYLEMLDDFNTLPYYELDWYTQDPSRVIKPKLKVQLMRSVGEKAKEIIQSYLDGDFEEIVVMRNGNPTKVISNEAVLYVNSVNHIISIIKKLNLQPDQVNILCSDTEENKNKIKKRLGKKYTIGKVPKKGEPRKMFTFCTRTVYLGADFYSEVARSFIFSDSNSDCLAVDISEDLPQILGRQRLFENPWKNTAEFYYRSTADYRKMNVEDFQNIIDTKRKKTEDLLRAFDSVPVDTKDSLAENYEFVAKNANYKSNYVAVNRVKDITGSVILKPVLNNLVLVNEIRAFKIQQIDYADRFAVFAAIHNKLTHDDIVNQEAAKFMEVYFSTTTRYEKFKLLCEYGLSQEAINLVLGQIVDSDEVKSCYTTLGPQRLRALSYDINRIRKELGIVVFSKERLIVEIYSNFHPGEKYTLANLKEKLAYIYNNINYEATPKASDIGDWFEVREILISEKKPDGGRKRIRAYELVGPKNNSQGDV